MQSLFVKEKKDAAARLLSPQTQIFLEANSQIISLFFKSVIQSVGVCAAAQPGSAARLWNWKLNYIIDWNVCEDHWSSCSALLSWSWLFDVLFWMWAVCVTVCRICVRTFWVEPSEDAKWIAVNTELKFHRISSYRNKSTFTFGTLTLVWCWYLCTFT